MMIGIVRNATSRRNYTLPNMLASGFSLYFAPNKRQHHSIISQELLKPSSPTPTHLNTYNLSFRDQRQKHKHMSVALFYPHNDNCSVNEKARKLKESLSQSLTHYYPLAGRLPTSTTPYVDCNDEGVVFVEAINDRAMETFQHMNIDDENLAKLFVDGYVGYTSSFSPIIGAVQLNQFSCGGIAVGVSVSHRVVDACTVGTFLYHWSLVARYGSPDHKQVLPLKPYFLQSPRTNIILPEADPAKIDQAHPTHVMKKFVFPNTKLSDLKNKVAALGTTSPIHNPTRAEVLISLLYKTSIASATVTSGSFNPSSLSMTVNARDKFVPKLPQTTFGNLVSLMVISTKHETETSLNVTVEEIKKVKSQHGVENLQQAAENFNPALTKVRGNDDLDDVATKSYSCSSLCWFPYNKVDFGWGKPTVSTMVFRSGNKDGFLLQDTPDGDGIEAHVNLEKQDMEIFENDKELLSFCQSHRLDSMSV